MSAVDGVDLALAPGEALALVGESGCGKSTLARTVVGLLQPQAGTVAIDGRPVRRRSRAERRRVQMVFQDPSSSLNPRLRVRYVLAELLRVNGVVPARHVERRCRDLMTSVGLGADTLDSFPATLSGGQRQRVSIARALALRPQLLVADEVTSALDVSVQAQVLALLLDLKEELGLTLLFISHNLAVVRQVCDRVAVMYLGRIVEEGPTADVFADPRHPYTRLLLASVPRIDEVNLGAAAFPDAEPPDAAHPPVGCRFHPRCPLAQPGLCDTTDPSLEHGTPDHAAACHFAWPAPERTTQCEL
jgi:oligopeptide/dipeptide ABC transporter ATP-binding protein